MVGQRILVPIKGVFLNAQGTKVSGFRNAIVSGVLLGIDEDGTVVLGNDRGEVVTKIPKDSVGALLTEASTFYQGTEDEDYVDFETEGGVN